jgi:predicted kinase
MIVIMAGLPASGKSTLCRKLAAKLNGIVLDEDKIRSALFSQADIEYSTTQDDFCMKVALEAAGYILRKNPGRFVSVDGRPFSRTYQLEQVLQAARDFNQEWRILECVCSEETARKRLAEQAAAGEHLAINRDYALYRRMRDQFEEIILPKTVIDTDEPLDACIVHGLAAISVPSTDSILPRIS